MLGKRRMCDPPVGLCDNSHGSKILCFYACCYECTLSHIVWHAAERVNLVANLDLPPSGESYAHRMGRTGRFGTRGVAVTFITAAELPALRRLLAGVPGAQVWPHHLINVHAGCMLWA